MTETSAPARRARETCVLCGRLARWRLRRACRCAPPAWRAQVDGALPTCNTHIAMVAHIFAEKHIRHAGQPAVQVILAAHPNSVALAAWGAGPSSKGRRTR